MRDFALVLIPLFSLVFSSEMVYQALGQETDANGNIDRREQEVWFLLVSSPALSYRRTVRRPARTEV